MNAAQIAPYIGCVIVSIALCFGQIMFKLAALAQPKGGFALDRLLLSPWFLGAIALYGLSTFLWVYVLARLPLSIAYPFTLLGAALVPVAAVFIFGEVLAARYWLGLGLMLGGLYLMNLK